METPMKSRLLETISANSTMSFRKSPLSRYDNSRKKKSPDKKQLTAQVQKLINSNQKRSKTTRNVFDQNSISRAKTVQGINSSIERNRAQLNESMNEKLSDKLQYQSIQPSDMNKTIINPEYYISSFFTNRNQRKTTKHQEFNKAEFKKQFDTVPIKFMGQKSSRNSDRSNIYQSMQFTRNTEPLRKSPLDFVKLYLQNPIKEKPDKLNLDLTCDLPNEIQIRTALDHLQMDQISTQVRIRGSQSQLSNREQLKHRSIQRLKVYSTLDQPIKAPLILKKNTLNKISNSVLGLDVTIERDEIIKNDQQVEEALRSSTAFTRKSERFKQSKMAARVQQMRMSGFESQKEAITPLRHDSRIVFSSVNSPNSRLKQKIRFSTAQSQDSEVKLDAKDFTVDCQAKLFEPISNASTVLGSLVQTPEPTRYNSSIKNPTEVQTLKIETVAQPASILKPYEKRKYSQTLSQFQKPTMVIEQVTIESESSAADLKSDTKENKTSVSESISGGENGESPDLLNQPAVDQKVIARVIKKMSSSIVGYVNTGKQVPVLTEEEQLKKDNLTENWVLQQYDHFLNSPDLIADRNYRAMRARDKRTKVKMEKDEKLKQENISKIKGIEDYKARSSKCKTKSSANVTKETPHEKEAVPDQKAVPEENLAELAIKVEIKKEKSPLKRKSTVKTAKLNSPSKRK